MSQFRPKPKMKAAHRQPEHRYKRGRQALSPPAGPRPLSQDGIREAIELQPDTRHVLRARRKMGVDTPRMQRRATLALRRRQRKQARR